MKLTRDTNIAQAADRDCNARHISGRGERPVGSRAGKKALPMGNQHLTAIANLLRQQSWRVSAAESVTGGRVQALLTSPSGASDYVAGGLTAYSLDEKVGVLGVARAIAEPVNCVSAEVASQMAARAATLFHTQVAVATTGYAEPYPAGQIAAPLAFVAVYVQGECHVERCEPTGTRNEVQQAIADAAVDLLRRTLESATERTD